MSRWQDLEGRPDAAQYAAHFARLEAEGSDVHGEAALVASLVDAPARVLDAGCGTGRVAVRLAALGYDCVGTDVDAAMLAQAREAAPGLPWVEADLATLDLPAAGESEPFDLVVAAGNVVPLVAPGTEAEAVRRMAAHLRPGGLLVAGFGLDAAHLPLPEATVDLPAYDAWCGAAGLTLDRRYATWEGAPYDGGGYAVSVHRRTAP